MSVPVLGFHGESIITVEGYRPFFSQILHLCKLIRKFCEVVWVSVAVGCVSLEMFNLSLALCESTVNLLILAAI